MIIHQIAVLREVRRVEIIVEMPDPDRLLTSQLPQLVRNLFRLLPTMAEHTCHNDLGIPFREECRHTEIPHLFEHLVLELQSRVEATDLLHGETAWDWRIDPRGFFTVTVEYKNDFLILGAIRLAERMIGVLSGSHSKEFNLEAELERLRAIGELGKLMEPVSDKFYLVPTDKRETQSRLKQRKRRTWSDTTTVSMPLVKTEIKTETVDVTSTVTKVEVAPLEKKEAINKKEMNMVLVALDALTTAADRLIATMDFNHLLFQSSIQEMQLTRLMIEESNGTVIKY